MNQWEIAGAAGLAFAAAVYLTASRASRIIFDNREAEDRSAAIEDAYPGPRRSLHYARQDIAGVLVAVIMANGLLAAILAVLLLRR